ncbi:MAG: response regulator [Phycisphaerae bacterium]|nr:response regulator [Planctomycetota bacterium]MBL7222104.1 response regulator [Phycisphaerae bacterium]
MPAAFKTLRDRRILIVDDSVQITSLLKEIFTECGATVVTANSGRGALGKLQSEEFDLVILDLVMPVPNGFDVLGFMRQTMPEMLERTILLTGDRYHQHLLHDIDETEVRVVFKPFNLRLLRSAACMLIKRARSLGAA